MVRERLDQYWIDRMYSIFENEPRLPDREVATRLQQEGEKLGRDDYPALRTVNKYHKKYIDEVDPEIKEGYREFRWPESMEQGALPWEASAAVLELLAIREHRDEFPKFLMAQGDKSFRAVPIMGRPSIRLARWYWHITQAAPDLPGDLVNQVFRGKMPDLLIEDLTTGKAWEHARKNRMPSRYDIASTLATWEAAGTSPPQGLRDAIELYLAYAPWRNFDNKIKYNIVVDSGDIPRLPLEDPHFNVFYHLPYSLEAMRESVGSALAEQWDANIQAWHSLTEEEKADIKGGIELEELTAYYKREIQRLRDELQKAGEKEDTDGEA
jgi:hypothetical protein